ncbi:MAG: Rhamnan synthesis protein [Belnapia sp.]|nr:Rhamnan synthesis protein [Belnapia sp.]
MVHEPYLLTELGEQPPGLRRAVHGYSTAGSWARLARRALQVGWEVARSLPRDALHRSSPGPSPLLRLEPGEDPRPMARSVALYVHYSGSGQVSAMVLAQLAGLAAEGFAVVFISMAPALPEADWQAVRARAALVVHRRNFGLDFGAWRDLAPEAARRWPGAEELLLANDSVLGPIRPMGPVLAALRSGGPGVFGLTESIQGGPHLQSYFLLIRGAAAIADLRHFLATLYVSHSKWLVIQRGELRFSRWMRRRGHRVAALFGYQRLVAATLADPVELAHLAAAHPLLRRLERLSPEARATALQDQLLNPSHHLWQTLVRRLGFPFVKTELVRRNPGRLLGVAGWPALVAPGAPVGEAEIRQHLDILGP